MKKVLVLVGVVVLMTTVLAVQNGNGEKLVTKKESENLSNAYYCPNCKVELQQVKEETPRYSPCYVCGGTDEINRTEEEWQDCSSCRGTGCKNGYTTDNGKYCAYGYCSYCNGDGGKYRNVMKKSRPCPSSSCKSVEIDGKFRGYGDIVYDYRYVYKCPQCGKTYN